MDKRIIDAKIEHTWQSIQKNLNEIEKHRKGIIQAIRNNNDHVTSEVASYARAIARESIMLDISMLKINLYEEIKGELDL